MCDGENQQQQEVFAGSVEASSVDELITMLTFTTTLCLSTNTGFGDEWYVDNGALRHMTYNKKIFNMLQEQEGRMCKVG
jgi:hypothetical protein